MICTPNTANADSIALTQNCRFFTYSPLFSYCPSHANRVRHLRWTARYPLRAANCGQPLRADKLASTLRISCHFARARALSCSFSLALYTLYTYIYIYFDSSFLLLHNSNIASYMSRQKKKEAHSYVLLSVIRHAVKEVSKICKTEAHHLLYSYPHFIFLYAI